jgi:hypothetical protein
VLLPVPLEEQLMPGTLEFAIHALVETRPSSHSRRSCWMGRSQQLSGIVASLRSAEPVLLAMFATVVKDFCSRVVLEDEDQDER